MNSKKVTDAMEGKSAETSVVLILNLFRHCGVGCFWFIRLETPFLDDKLGQRRTTNWMSIWVQSCKLQTHFAKVHPLCCH